ncbi:MAG: putative Ig domain-containing protein, partial [Limisphaerales bacterium]
LELQTTFTTIEPVTDLPVNFLKGIINVGASGPFCLDSICGQAGGSFPYGQSYSFDFDCDEPGVWSVVSGPGTINPNTGLYTFDDACFIGVLPVTVRFTDTLGFFSECDFVMNATSPAFICAADQETIWVSHGTAAQNQITAFQPPTGDGIVFTRVLGPGTIDGGGLWSHQATCADVSQSFPLTIRIQISDTVRGCPFGFLVDTCEFKLFVTNAIPEIANFPNGVVYLDTNSTFSLQLIPDDLDPADSVLTFFLVFGPSGLTVSSSGFLEWTPAPAQVGTAEARVRVRDGCGVNREYRVVFAVSSEIQRGDLNADGQLSPADVVALLNCVYLGVPPFTGEESCDMNCDGQHSPADVVLLLKRVYLVEPLPC